MTPDELEKTLERLYNSAQSASSEGLTDEAVRRCEEALELIETYGEDGERHSYGDFIMLTGDVHWGAGDYEQAYRAYHKVMTNEPDRQDARVAVGVALYHLGRFGASQNLLEMASLDDPEDAETWYYLGLLALRRGQRDLAMIHFESAHELENNRFYVPVEIPPEEIVALVEAMVEEIPEPLRQPLQNVPIIVEDHPSEAMLYGGDPPMDPLLLGIFDGIPLTEPQDLVTSPTRIVLYLENIWLLGYSREVLEEELWVTLKHEIGHYFGLNEDELAERGLD